MKTRITLNSDMQYEPIYKGETGYIDGYVVGGDGRPCAVIVVGEVIALAPISILTVINNPNQ